MKTPRLQKKKEPIDTKKNASTKIPWDSTINPEVYYRWRGMSEEDIRKLGLEKCEFLHHLPSEKANRQAATEIWNAIRFWLGPEKVEIELRKVVRLGLGLEDAEKECREDETAECQKAPKLCGIAAVRQKLNESSRASPIVDKPCLMLTLLGWVVPLNLLHLPVEAKPPPPTKKDEKQKRPRTLLGINEKKRLRQAAARELPIVFDQAEADQILKQGYIFEDEMRQWLLWRAQQNPTPGLRRGRSANNTQK